MHIRICFVVVAVAPAAWAQCLPEELTTLGPSEPVIGDDFGLSVSISGDAILIGSRRSDGAQDSSGAAFVYRLDEESWVEEAKITLGDGETLDQFGQSVVLAGSLALIGAPGDGDGAVHAFEYDGDAWSFVESIVPKGLEPLDFFGGSVALSGDTLVVGATRDDEVAQDAGAAYVFQLIEGVWTEQIKLFAEDGAVGDGFGIVDISGDVIVVGAPGAADGAGAVYVYRLIDDAWTLESTLAPKELEAEDRFSRVSIWNDLLVVGAPGDDDAGDDAGAIYPYRYDGRDWNAEPKILASDAMAGDQFGNCVKARGSIVLVGANLDDDNGASSGSAYLLRHEDGIWLEDAKLLASDGAPAKLFGGINDSIDIGDAGLAVIGAPSNGGGFGSAYVFATNCPPCAADINGDGELTVVDFVEFQLAFQANDPLADCDDNGAWNINDFVCYQLLFQAGCE